MWTNNAFTEAFDLLNSIDTDKLLSTSSFILLFKFLMVSFFYFLCPSLGFLVFFLILFKEANVNKVKHYVYQNHSGVPSEKTFYELYYKVYTYIYNKILSYPPLTGEICQYFITVFDSLIMRDRMWALILICFNFGLTLGYFFLLF